MQVPFFALGGKDFCEQLCDSFVEVKFADGETFVLGSETVWSPPENDENGRKSIRKTSAKNMVQRGSEWVEEKI